MKFLFEYIKKSLFDSTGKISSSRISSYFILLAILVQSVIFSAIEISNFIKSVGIYTVPSEHIIIFGMVLAHHLTLLGIRITKENK